MLLPSLLEYSTHDLNQRLDQILELLVKNQYFDKVYITHDISENILSLHLDFVLSQFAKDRNPILASLSPNEVFNCLKLKFPKQKLDLTVHIMGELEDLPKAWQYFETLRKPKHWNMTLFLPYNQAVSWRRTFKKYKIGAWIDLRQWCDLDQSEKKSKAKLFDLKYIDSVLVMSVVAGKSGQKLTLEVEANLDKLIRRNPQFTTFVIDGGWDQEKAENFMRKNNPQSKVDFVSYSGFWAKL